MTEGERRSRLFREVNSRIRELNHRWDVPGPAGFFCECERADCANVLDLTVADYDVLRAAGSGYVVVAGHQASAADRVAAPGASATPPVFPGAAVSPAT